MIHKSKPPLPMNLNQRKNIFLDLTDNISRRVVGADNVLAPVFSRAVLVGTTKLGSTLPDNLGKVVPLSGGVVVVVVTFHVPGIKGSDTAQVSDSQVFTVLTTGVDQATRTQVAVGIVLSILIEVVTPGQGTDTMVGSLLVMGIQD